MAEFGKLRKIQSDELELMLSWRNAPNVRANMYTTHEISLEEHIRWWESVKQSRDKKYFMYEYGGEPTGIVGFTNIDHKNENSCWAFYAAPSAPKGTGSRMEFLALEFAFNDLDLHKLYCEVLAFNSPVIRLHHKFGFQTEGVFKDHHKTDNRFVDIHRLALFDQIWAEKRRAIENKLSRFT